MEKETSFFFTPSGKQIQSTTTTVVSISPRKNEENGLHYEKSGALRVGGSIPFDLEIDLRESEGKILLLTDACNEVHSVSKHHLFLEMNAVACISSDGKGVVYILRRLGRQYVR